MNYNKYLIPKVPDECIEIAASLPDHVYIGKGTASGLAEKNGGNKFLAVRVSNFLRSLGKDYVAAITRGEDINSYYFVHKDAPILGAMFPYDPDYADKEIARLKKENADLKDRVSDLEDKLSDVRDAVEGWKENY